MKMMLRISFIVALFILSTSAIQSQEIIVAAASGNLDKVKEQINNNPQLVNVRDANGLTPLHCAVRGNHLEILKILLENGADVNIKTSSDESALHFAATRGYSDIVKLLLENGAYLEATNKYQRTPLLVAARERGGIETIQTLVEGGANINATDFFGDTPLTLAAWRGYEDIVDYLLGVDAHFSTSGEEGIKLFKYAVDKRLWNLYKSMINKGGERFLSELQRKPVLHWATAGGSDNIVRELINLGFRVNDRDSYLWVPLHYASYFGRLEVAKLLIEKGAEINIRTPLGETPYYLAGSENKNEVIDLLKSVDVDQTTPRSTEIYGKFMGQKKPGNQLELFAPGIVSRLKGGHSNITFSPDGKMAFWTEWILKDVGYSPGCIVWFSKMTDYEWTLPEKFLSMGDTPVFSVDGKKVYLMATFSTLQASEKNGIWYYEIKKDTIIGPNYLDFDVNRSGLYWQYSFDKNENLYFSNDEGGLFRSIRKDDKYSDTENLAEIFHPDYKGGSPYVSPEGDYIIFNSMELPGSYGSHDLYIGYKKTDGTWSKPINMGPTINSSALENLAMVSTDGEYLFLRTERNGVSGIYWVSAKIIEDLRPKDL